MDAKGKSKKTCFLCEKLIQSKTPGFTREILYERVKHLTIQRNIGDFHKDFYIYRRSYYKILGKHNFYDVRHKTFESTPSNISTWLYYAKQFILEPDGQLQNEFFHNNRTLSMEGCSLYCFKNNSM